MIADIFDTPLQLPGPDFRFSHRALADGLRASTVAECPSMAVLQYIAPNDPRCRDYFNPGVATLGHALAQMWAHQAFADDGYELEPPIPWTHGISHDDILVHRGRWAGVYEVKTHSSTDAVSPSEANRRQVRLRMRLRELNSGGEVDPIRIVMIGKAGREGAWVRGPWLVELTDEDRAWADDLLGRVDHLMAKAASLDLEQDTDLKAACQCSSCFPKPREWADAGTDDLLQAYGQLAAEHRTVKEAKQQYLDRERELKQRQAELKEQLGAKVADGVVVEGITHTATRRKDGALVIAPVKGVAA